MKKVMLSAGEVSGDIHGTHLVREIKKLSPDIFFFGMGSEKLLAEGVDIRVDISKRGTIGIFEALPNALPIYFSYLKLVALLKKEKPDLLLLVDSQGINMPLAKAAKKLGIKTVYYIPPQEWLWGTERGVKKVAENIGLIISIFKKEYDTYKKAGANVVYFGHPLVDILGDYSDRFAAKDRLLAKGVELLSGTNAPVIALCPGSRTQEIKALLPVLLSAAKRIKKDLPGAQFIIPAASTSMIKLIFSMIDEFRPKAIVGQTHEILAVSDLAICASGTINLEASILGVPNMMVYKLSPLTYWVGKNILKLDQKLPYFSMPNLLLNEKAIPELVMGNATPKNIASEALSILSSAERVNGMRASFQKLRSLLGSPGVIAKCAESIVKELS